MMKYAFAVLAVAGLLVLPGSTSAFAEDTDQTNTPKPQWIQNGLYLGKGSGGTSTPNATATSSNPLVIFGTSTLGGGCKIDSNGNLVNCQDAGFADNVTISGTTSFSVGKVDTTGDLVSFVDAGFSNNATVGASLTVGAAGGGAQFNLNSDANILGDAGVGGNATITGNLTATAQATFSAGLISTGSVITNSVLNRVPGTFQGTRTGATWSVNSGASCGCSFTSECMMGTAVAGSDGGVLLCNVSGSTLTVTTPCNDAGVMAVCF